MITTWLVDQSWQRWSSTLRKLVADPRSLSFPAWERYSIIGRGNWSTFSVAFGDLGIIWILTKFEQELYFSHASLISNRECPKTCATPDFSIWIFKLSENRPDITVIQEDQVVLWVLLSDYDMTYGFFLGGKRAKVQCSEIGIFPTAPVNRFIWCDFRQASVIRAACVANYSKSSNILYASGRRKNNMKRTNTHSAHDKVYVVGTLNTKGRPYTLLGASC